MAFHHSTNGFVVLRCSYTFHTEQKLVQRWRISSPEDQAKVFAKKKLVHDRFKAELGLRINEPKWGAGNTNDGNTAQRAFEQEEKLAKICDLDESLIHRFHMILVAISCKHPIDPNKFQTYCHDKAELLVHLYPWFRMPVSIHVLLIHGAAVLASSIIPISIGVSWVDLTIREGKKMSRTSKKFSRTTLRRVKNHIKKSQEYVKKPSRGNQETGKNPPQIAT